MKETKQQAGGTDRFTAARTSDEKSSVFVFWLDLWRHHIFWVGGLATLERGPES